MEREKLFKSYIKKYFVNLPLFHINFHEIASSFMQIEFWSV